MSVCLSLWALGSHVLQLKGGSENQAEIVSALNSSPLTISLLEAKNDPIMLIKQQLEKEMVFFGEDDHHRLLIGLLSNKTQHALEPKKWLFLSFPQGIATFSSQGPLKVSCEKITGELIHVNIFIPSLQKTLSFEKNIESSLSSMFLEFPKECQELESAKVYKPDLLLIRSGEKAYCRLMMPYQQKQLYLEQGSWLSYEKGSWNKKAHQGSCEAVVEEMSSDRVSIRVLDRVQGVSKLLSIQYQEEDSLSFSLGDLFKDLKVRGEGIVACKIGKQKCLLKKGDWLIKNQSYWKTINSSVDLERCLNFELMGELFVFEGLEKKQGQLFFKGVLFSKMRTRSYPIEIPVNFQGSLVETKPSRTFQPRKEKRVLEAQPDQDELLKLKGK